MKDNASMHKGVNSINPASITATTTGSAVALAGYESATVYVTVGAVATADASNYVTFTVTESVDGSTYTALDSGDYVTNGDSWDRIINATTEADATYSFGITSSTAGVSHVKVVATETGTTEAIFGAIVVKGHPALQPAT